jgi:hypothetical protein
MTIYTTFEKINLSKEPGLNEKWVQDRIAENPAILGLGELILKDKERIQPKAGRLDLLLQDPDNARRFEVELQLGALDESHIIRTIEYWDIERKRYPMYDHTAVVIAENITSRFLNVLSLFNGSVPIVAIQMNALRVEGKVGLLFTTVLDHVPRGLEGEDEETQEITDRNYWESKSNKKMLQAVDQLFTIVKSIDPALELKYNKFYIGLGKQGVSSLFTLFRPRKAFVRIEPKLPRSPELDEKMDAAGLDVMDYDARWGRYRINLQTEDVEKHKELLQEITRLAYAAINGD